MKHRITQWITPAVFLTLIFGLTTANLLTGERDFSEVENRELAKMPEFQWDALLEGDYTAGVETYLTDQFVARDAFVGLKTQTDYLVGKRDANEVYFGQDGYLIEKHTEESLDREQMEKNIDRLSRFSSFAVEELGEDGVRVMIVPTAGEILKEKLPPFAQEFSQTAMLAAIEASLPQGTFVDMLPVLEEHRDEYIYYKTDHHWTSDGAYYGYHAYCESIGTAPMEKSEFEIQTVSDRFYGTIYSKARLASTRPDSVTAYFPKEERSFHVDYNLGAKQTDTLYDESWLSKKDKYSYFLGGNNAVVKITGGPANGKKLLLVKDSYAHCMAPFLANEYEEIDMIDLRYFNMSLREYLQENEFTDVLVLYNAVTFSDDLSVLKMDR